MSIEYNKEFKKLNPAQKEAVLHKNGACCVISGAGSGKTKVLTLRVANLIKNHNIIPENILTITFTRKAAEEMKERLDMLEIDTSKLFCNTIHSFCFSVCRNYWIDKNSYKQWFKVAQNWQIKKALKEALEKSHWKTEKTPGELHRLISFNKNNLLTMKSETLLLDDDIHPGAFKRFWFMFEESKNVQKIIEFDDMIVECYNILKNNPQILTVLANKYKYILVDEYQDTNILQNKIISMIAQENEEHNIFVVGDDKQSIYRFNAANVELILNFCKKWDAKLVNLSINYRSLPDILDLANNLIKNNTMQEEKTLINNPFRKLKKKQDNNIFINTYIDEEDQANNIKDEIKNILAEGRNYKDIAILYRTNAQSRALEDTFIKDNIPYVIYGSISFYQRAEIQDIISYLKFVVDHNNFEAFSRSLKTPSRYASNVFIDQVSNYSINNEASLLTACKKLAVKRFKQVIDYIRWIEDLKNIDSPAQMIKYIRDAGYDQYIKDENNNDPDDERLENLTTLECSAGNFTNVHEFLNHIEQVIESQKNKNNDIDVVRLMTIHKSKGLEFPVVFIVNCNEGLLPHVKNTDIKETGVDAGVEEERRLMYVAITRAKDRLYVSSTSIYNDKPAITSRFVTEMRLDILLNENIA